MTTNPMEALARLQENPKQADQRTIAWLNANKDDVITLCQDKGIQIAAELLGIKQSAIYNWRHQRGLDFKTPRLSRDGRFVLVDEDGKRVRTDRYKAPTHGETVEPPPLNSAAPAHPEPVEGRERDTTPPSENPDYIRGQRDAYRHALALFAPAVKLPSH